ncbi:hypothetical protein HYFRA_00004927 [Hymenoscyphus fraxineus]|uniref:Uncharacterized protein n=1 Tax=Hymenoscyphus fraxineus TaxID=746836 RepID=A0A9N9KPL3_9HELO|nr:hypothetical protein HYFRA_00004927 [Hymenoscyphus fraxineus]
MALLQNPWKYQLLPVLFSTAQTPTESPDLEMFCDSTLKSNLNLPPPFPKGPSPKPAHTLPAACSRPRFGSPQRMGLFNSHPNPAQHAQLCTADLDTLAGTHAILSCPPFCLRVLGPAIRSEGAWNCDPMAHISGDFVDTDAWHSSSKQKHFARSSVTFVPGQGPRNLHAP